MMISPLIFMLSLHILDSQKSVLVGMMEPSDPY